MGHQKPHTKHTDEAKKKHDEKVPKTLVSIGLFSHGVSHGSHDASHAKGPEEAHASSSRVAPPVPGTTPGTKAKINVTTPATSALIAVMVTPFFMA